MYETIAMHSAQAQCERSLMKQRAHVLKCTQEWVNFRVNFFPKRAISMYYTFNIFKIIMLIDVSTFLCPKTVQQ
jgi:hypothetical protein